MSNTRKIIIIIATLVLILSAFLFTAFSFFNRGYLAYDWYEKNYNHFMSIGMSVGEGAAGTIRRADDSLPELDVYLGGSSKENYFDIYFLLKNNIKNYIFRV